MDLTKDDLEDIRSGYQGLTIVDIEQILKNQEDAQAHLVWIQDFGEFAKMGTDKLKQMKEDAEKFRETQEQLYYRNYKIVERLKKQIEELHKDGVDMIHRTELQKILDGKDEAN